MATITVRPYSASDSDGNSITSVLNGGEYKRDVYRPVGHETHSLFVQFRNLDIPDGSVINSATVLFRAKSSRGTTLYELRWNFRAFQYRNASGSTVNDYVAEENTHVTSKLSTNWKDCSFKFSDYFTVNQEKLKNWFSITLQEYYSCTLSTTIYMSDLRLVIDYTPPSHYLDLNGFIDGASSGGISPAGTADVYINGALASNDCADYYTQHIYGSTYEIKDIRANAGYRYVGVKSGSLSGTITENTAVVLEFERLPPKIADVKLTYQGLGVNRLNKVPCGEGFLLSVQVTFG